MRKISITLFFSLLFLMQCGSEIGKIPIKEIGPVSSTQIKIIGDKKITFWTQLDIKYDGNVGMNYFISFLKNGTMVSQAICNPFNVNIKIKSLITNLNDHHTKHYLGKMSCETSLPESGEYTVNTQLMLLPDSPSPTLTQADLILKQ